MRFQSAKGLNVKKQFIFFALLLSISATCCSLTSGYDNWYGAGMGAMGGYGMGGWGWGGAAGGVGEIYSGMGNMVRAEGQRNLLDAQAEKTQQQAWQEHEKARTLHIENQQKIHAELQKRKRESQAQDAEDREAARAARERQQAFMDAHRPQPLASNQFDPATATIDWPPALRASGFDELRKSLDTSLQNRSKYGSTSDLSRQISRTIGELKDLLRSQILTIPMPDYSEARKFLDRLAVSAP